MNKTWSFTLRENKKFSTCNVGKILIWVETIRPERGFPDRPRLLELLVERSNSIWNPVPPPHAFPTSEVRAWSFLTPNVHRSVSEEEARVFISWTSCVCPMFHLLVPLAASLPPRWRDLLTSQHNDTTWVLQVVLHDVASWFNLSVPLLKCVLLLLRILDSSSPPWSDKAATQMLFKQVCQIYFIKRIWLYHR